MKTTIVYVTHDQIEAMTLATKIAVLKDGILQQFGTPAEIYNNPANLFVADFMGSPAMNLLTATVEGGGNDLRVSLVRPDAEPLHLPVAQVSGLAAYSGKQVVFGIRPEALTDPDGADRNARLLVEGDCLIEVVEPAGSDTFAVTKLGGKEVVARLRADARIAPGTEYQTGLQPGQGGVFRSAKPAAHRLSLTMITQPDIVIIGSGIGGATVASALAGSGACVAILERGERLADTPETRSYRSIFVDGHFRPKEMWREPDGTAFNPGNFYFVGGNSKLFGAVLLRYRAEDFTEMQHLGGVSPAWPFPYEELEPWYGKAERLFDVRGELGQDPTEPSHSTPYPHGPVPDEPSIARARAELAAQGLHPATLPLGVDIDAWLAGGRTPWDGFPNTGQGKRDAETAPLAAALKDPNIELITSAHVETLQAGPGGRIEAVHYTRHGERKRPLPEAGDPVGGCDQFGRDPAAVR